MKGKRCKWGSRMLAGMLAALMVVPMILEGAPAWKNVQAAAGDMLPIDSGFEQAEWYIHKQDDRKMLWEKSAKEVRSGQYAGRFYYNANGAKGDKYAEVSHKAFAVEPNTIYELTYYIKNVGLTNVHGYLGVKDSKTGAWFTGNKVLSEMKPNANNSAADWTKMSVIFTTDKTSTQAQIYLTMNLNQVKDLSTLTDGASFYIDDLSIQNLGNASLKVDLAEVDGKKVGEWAATPDGLVGDIETKQVKSGEGLKISSSLGKTGSSFHLTSSGTSIKSGKIYEVSYYVRTFDFPGINYGITIFDADTGKVLATNIGTGKTGPGFGTAWKECSGLFATETNTKKIKIKISAYVDAQETNTHEAGASFYVDDIVIREVSQEVINDGTFDGDFERVYRGTLLNWSSGSGSNGLAVSAGKEAYKGKTSLQIANKTGKAGEYQMIESNPLWLKANTTYDITYYVKNKNFQGAVGYASVVDGAKELNERGVFTIDDSFSEVWKKQTVRFTMDSQDKEVYLRFTVRSAKAVEAGALLYIDTVSIEQVEQEGINDGQLDEGFERVYHGKFVNWSASDKNMIAAEPTTKAHTGKYALRLVNGNTKKGYQEVVSNKYQVKPNTLYDISYFMKNVDFPVGSTGYVAVFDARDTSKGWLGTRKDLGNYTITDNFSTAWKRYVGQFATKEDTTEIVVKFVVSTMAAAATPEVGKSLYIDDLLIEESIPETTLIKNPDFERIDLISWRTVRHPMNSEGKVDTKIPNRMDSARVSGGQSGNYSLCMQTDVRGYVAVLQEQPFAVEPDSTYKFTYFVRTENAADTENYAMFLAFKRDGVTSALGNYTQTMHIVGNQAGWKKVVSYFTTASDQYYMNIQLCLSATADFKGIVPAMAWFDNLNLEKVPTIGEKDNLGFEYIEDETLYDWTYTVLGSGKDALKMDTSKYDWKMETKQVKEGKKALKVISNSTAGMVLLTSRRLTVKGGSMYRLSYWVKADGAVSSSVNIGAHYTLPNGKPASKEWEWASDSRVAGATKGWKQVITYITAPKDAAFMDIRINVTGSRTEIYLDQIAIEEYILDSDQNFSFENGDHNWKISGGDAVIDTTVYHSGKKSLHVTKSSQQDTKVTSMVYTPVKYGDRYIFGGWYRSSNNINSRVRFNLNCYDAQGNMLKSDGSRRIILGSEVTGNTDAKPSGWARLMFSGNIPDGTVTVGLEIVMTDGRAEMWFDDLFLRKCNLSDEEMLVDYNTMDQVDHEGNIESVSLELVSGEASIEQKNGVVSLNVKENAESYIACETDYMLSGNTYKVLLHNYTAAQNAKVVIKHYDYKGNYIEGVDTVADVPASAGWADYELNVVVPSSVTTKICFGGTAAGTYAISQIDIVEVEQKDEAASWVGRWIWYNEDTLTNCQYQTRYFRHKFILEEKAIYAPLQITCDDLYTVYVNGQEVGSDMESTVEEWGTPTTYDLVPYLKKGENIIAVEGYNRVSYGALLYDVRVTMENEKQVYVCSNADEVVSSMTSSGDWTAYGYNDSDWKKPKNAGKVGTAPWGEIFFDASLYADKKITISSFQTRGVAHTDSKVKIDAEIEIEEPFQDDYPIEVNVYKKNTTTLITTSILEIVKGSQPSKWKAGKNKVTFEMYIPDYLDTGNYTLQLSDSYYYLMNEGIIERKFANITVLQANEKQKLATAEIRTVNGTPTIFVNGEIKPSMLYQEPAGNLWFDVEKEAKYMEGTDSEIYIANRVELWDQSKRSGSLWLDENTMDWGVLDNVVYSILSADPDALIMPTIGMRAPVWWLDQNPDEELLLYDAEKKEYTKASVRSESFSSEKWKETSSEVIREIIEHMMKASYAGHIVGVRFVDGDTSEFMTQDVEDGIVADFSPASLNGFRTYLKEKYQTVEALRKAYKNSKVTFENVTIPTYDDRTRVWLSTNGVSDTIIKDAKNDRWVIDYNYYSGRVASEMFISYCEALKETTDGKWLTGGYHGYTWVFAGIGGIARTHPAVDIVLESDAVDFICSPYIYGERTKGENSPFDDMIDGVQKAGKLYILEVDTRSVYEGSSGNADTDASVGTCYTMAESIESLKRDLSALVAKGAGFWVFNMYGIWWYDDQMLSALREVKKEMEYSMFMGSETLSDVAVYVDEMNYPYLSHGETYSATRTYYYLYMWQRRNLATMGAAYDLYNMSDLVKGNTKKDYKINIMLSPYEITPEEKVAIEKELKRDGKIIIWVNLAGISDGTKNDIANIKALTGFDVQYVQSKGALTGSFVSGHELTKGIEGYIYGDDATGATNGVGPLLYVDKTKDSKVVELAQCVFDDTKSALVMKDMGDWTTIYSGPCGLPNGFLRNLVAYAGGHIYSDNTSDIVHASAAYVSVYSLYGGSRTITLPEKASVYDVYEKKYVTMNDDTFSFYLEDNETKLFRLMETDKVAVTALTRGGHAVIDKPGITELTPGDTYTVKIEVEDGYQLSSVRVDDKEIEITDTITFKNIDDTHHVMFETEQIKTYGVYVDSLDVRWGKIMLLAACMIGALALTGTAIEVGVVCLRRKKSSEERV